MAVHTLRNGRTIALGRSAPSPKNPRDLHIARFLKSTATLASPPATNDYLEKVVGIENAMFGNDKYGDCVFASSAHRLMVQTAMIGKQVTPTADAVIHAYARQTGFNPATGAGDNGAVEVDALNWERHHLIGGGSSPGRVFAFARLDPTDVNLRRQCAYYFGGVWYGINLPVTAQAQVGQVWDVTDPRLTGDAAPGSWGGHAVFTPAYDPTGETCVTWAARQRMTNAFISAYADEAWVILPAGWHRADPFAVLNWSDLDAAVATFGPVDPQQ